MSSTRHKRPIRTALCAIAVGGLLAGCMTTIAPTTDGRSPSYADLNAQEEKRPAPATGTTREVEREHKHLMHRLIAQHLSGATNISGQHTGTQGAAAAGVAGIEVANRLMGAAPTAFSGAMIGFNLIGALFPPGSEEASQMTELQRPSLQIIRRKTLNSSDDVSQTIETMARELDAIREPMFAAAGCASLGEWYGYVVPAHQKYRSIWCKRNDGGGKINVTLHKTASPYPDFQKGEGGVVGTLRFDQISRSAFTKLVPHGDRSAAVMYDTIKPMIHPDDVVMYSAPSSAGRTSSTGKSLFIGVGQGTLKEYAINR